MTDPTKTPERLIGGWPEWAVDEVAMHRPFPKVGAITTRDRRLTVVVAVRPGNGRRPTYATVWLLPINDAWVADLVAAASAVVDGRRLSIAQRARLAHALGPFRPSEDPVAVPVAVQPAADPEDRA